MAKQPMLNDHGLETLSRRDLFWAGALGVPWLAGCIGDDDVGEVEIDDAETPEDVEATDNDAPPDDPVDQTFVLPTKDNPEEGSIIMRGPPMPEEFETRYGFASHVYRTMYEPVVWGRFMAIQVYTPAPGEPQFSLLDDFEVLEDRYRYTIHEDANWSDGEPIRALDGPGGSILSRFASLPIHGQWLYEDNPDLYEGVHQIWVDVEFPEGKDGKVFDLVAPEGHEDRFQELWEDQEHRGYTYGRVTETDGVLNWPTHIEPYNSLIHELLDEVERGLDGEEVREASEITGEHIDESTYERFRDPDNVLTSGPWTLSEIRGAEEWVLEKNEHHRWSDDINFSEIRMPWIEEEHRLHAELQAGRPDAAQIHAGPDLTQDIEEAGYTQLLSPTDEDGGAVCFRHNHPVFGKVKVRQAVGHVIDQYEVANTVHPDITVPYDIPGGDMPGRVDFIDDAWVEDNLRPYPHDLDKAEELMIEAGLERGTDDSWLYEGEPIEEEYPTTDDTPIEERVVVDQLNEFGFNLQLVTMEDDIYAERFEDQDFGIFPSGPTYFGNFLTGTFMRSIFANWMIFLIWSTNQGWQLFEPEGVNDEIAEMLEEYGWQPLLDEHLDPYVKVPPIGEWDAEPEQFYLPDRVNEVFYQGDSTHPDYLDMLKKLTWTANWMLPVYPMYGEFEQTWLNMEDWNWPTDHGQWEYFGLSSDAADHLSLGHVTANPEG